MKKLIFLFLIFPTILFAQKKGHIEGPIYLKNDCTVQMNQQVVDYLTANLDNIESIDGETIIYVPIEREYKKARRSWLIDGYLTQYDWFINPNTKDWDVAIWKIKTTYIEFDFVKQDTTRKHKNDDDYMFDKPKKLKEKIKAKDKKKGK